MTGPARAGILLYASDRDLLVSFYADLLQADIIHSTRELSVLQGADLQLVIHDLAQTFDLPETALRRRDLPIKFFFSVASIDETSQQIRKLGGEVDESRWAGEAFTLANGFDPEGNGFQYREWR